MTTSVGKSPSYLFLNGQIYYFRMSIPPTLRESFGKTEIRCSLKTGYLHQARVKSRRLAMLIHSLMSQVRKGDNSMSKLTTDQIKEIVDGWVNESLEDDERKRAVSKPIRIDEYELEKLELLEEALSNQKTDILEELALSNHQRATSQADELLNERGIKIGRDTESYKILSREIMKGHVQILKVILDRMSSQYPNHDNMSGAVPIISPTANKGILLSEAIEKFTEEKIRSGEWAKASTKDMTPDLKVFLELTGDIDCSFITKDHVRHFREIVMKLPKRHRQKKCYRDLPLEEIVSLDIPEDELQSPTSINNKLVKLGGFLTWLNNMDYNNVSGLNSPLKTLKPKNRNASDKIPFTIEDLQKLFIGKGYGDNTLKKPYHFWIPLLGLFTGARLAELCQLHVEDVKVVDGVWVIDINDYGDKHVKTRAGIRQVPLHSVLVEELGFPSFVEKVKAGGNVRLFPELKIVKKTGRSSDSASKWFNRRVEEVGIIKDTPEGKKVFHSFRGTFTNYCKQHDIHDKKVKQIVGHSTGNDITEQHYNQAYSMSKLYEDVISKIDWGIDFSLLADSKYVVRKGS